MIRTMLLTSLFTVTSVWSQDLTRLPSWAQQDAQAAATATPPADADAWVVLDRTEIAYVGRGEIRTRKLRLVKVITERGTSVGIYRMQGLGGNASRVNGFKGWNLRPDGDMETLKKDSVVRGDLSSSTEVSTSVFTVGALNRVVKGSWVAFESLESFTFPMGPYARVSPMDIHPVRRWEVVASREKTWFGPSVQDVSVQMGGRNLEPWISKVEQVPQQSFRLLDVPPLPKDEGATPYGGDVLPWVFVRFMDPALTTQPRADHWDDLTRWIETNYTPTYAGSVLTGTTSLASLHQWMGRNMIYRQVYLSPERGWVPEKTEASFRKRYGDCKDLAAFFISEARALGFKAHPVLCAIQTTHARPEDPSDGLSFNHVIAAVELKETLGLPAEVVTAQGRFLILDLTASLTPFGMLPTSHQGRQVMICKEGKAIWAPIPEAALEPLSLRFALKGRMDGNGALTGELTIQEQGDARDFRSTARDNGPRRLVEHLLSNLVDLPATGTVEYRTSSDPLDLAKPFQVVFTLRHPKAMGFQGGEGFLSPLGWILPASPIQKPGQRRQLPVEITSRMILDYQLELEIPWKVVPVVPEQRLDTPFRQGQWRCQWTPRAPGGLLTIAYHQDRRYAYFGFDKREEGLAEWKKDRRAYQGLTTDGFLFKQP